MKKSTMSLLAAWPTNEALPQSVLDLYGSSNLSSRAWAFLSSHPATNPPASFSVDPAALPWYDQASALVVLGRLLGINVEYKYMTRFGYINPTALVDISPCNNPFYPITTSHEPMTGVDEVWPVRSSFGNHAFSMCDDLVYDACVGPVTGIPLNRYLDDSIDASTSDEELKSGKTSTPNTGIIEKSY